MTFVLSLPEHIRSLPPYIPGRGAGEVAREFGLEVSAIVKLASNENPLGMSAAVERALRQGGVDICRYPDSEGDALKSALALMLGIEKNFLVLGNGSSEILEMAARAFLASDRNGIMSEYAFAVYPLAIQSAGAKVVTVPALAHGHDLEAMAASVTPQTGLIFVANPNNPTGTHFGQGAFERFMEAIDGRTVVVLDEAYQEYLDPSERFDSAGLVKRFANLIVSRTFSKAYGLAGLRVGYAIAQPELVQALNRVRPVFNVNVMAQVAALAALGDLEFLAQTKRVNDDGLAYLQGYCAARSMRYVPSRGNFMLIHVADAERVNRHLLANGVIVRPVANYGLPDWLRVSVGLPEQNRRFAQALDDALQS